MSQNEVDQLFFGELPREERERFLDELENEFADLDKAIESHVDDFRGAQLRQILFHRPLLKLCFLVAFCSSFLHPPILIAAIIWLPLLLSLTCRLLLAFRTTELAISIRNFCTALRWDVAMSSVSDIKPARVIRRSEPMETAPTGKGQFQ